MSYVAVTPPVTIYTGNPPLHAGGFQDLDLSSVIGATQAFVYLAVNSTLNGQQIAFRAKGDTNNTYPREPDPSYGIHTGATNRNYYGHGGRQTYGFIAMTDANGITQWKARYNDSSLTVKVYGWVPLDGAPYAQVASVPMDQAYHAVDLSSIIGSNRAMIMLRFRQDTGLYPDRIMASASSGRNVISTDRGSNVCDVYWRTVDPVNNYVVLTTNSSGIVYVKTTYNRVGHNFFVDLVGYVVDEGSVVLVFPSGSPPTPTPDVLDLSPWVGSQIALVNLLILGTNVNHVNLLFAPSGDPDPWFTNYATEGEINNCGVALNRFVTVIVPTNEEGKVDWRTFTHVSYTCAIYLDGYQQPPPPLGIDYSIQKTLNTVEITFVLDPRHTDPYDPTDCLNLDNYSVVGPVVLYPDRIIQFVEYIGDNTVRVWFDGNLVSGESYEIIVSNLVSVDDIALDSPASTTLTAFYEDRAPIPLRFEEADSWDIANPQVARDAQGFSLGTIGADEEGDVAVEARRASLRKRVIRRCTTGKGSFAHLAGYGLNPGEKKLLRPSELRRLQQDAEAQVAAEPDVVAVRAMVSQPSPGVVWLSLVVEDRQGQFTISTLLSGGQS